MTFRRDVGSLRFFPKWEMKPDGGALRESRMHRACISKGLAYNTAGGPFGGLPLCNTPKGYWIVWTGGVGGLQGAQPMPSHCPADKLEWHLKPKVTAPNRFGNLRAAFEVPSLLFWGGGGVPHVRGCHNIKKKTRSVQYAL